MVILGWVSNRWPIRSDVARLMEKGWIGSRITPEMKSGMFNPRNRIPEARLRTIPRETKFVSIEARDTSEPSLRTQTWIQDRDVERIDRPIRRHDAASRPNGIGLFQNVDLLV